MGPTATPLVWGAYLRISEDPNDLRRGVNRQRDITAEEIARLGADPSTVVWYEENDTSAYKKRRVELTDPMGRKYVGYRVIRPVWADALHDLRTGRINALAVYDLDRLARDPRDLEDAIEVVQHYGAVIRSATSPIDLSTDDGQSWARGAIAHANRSSADTSRRVRAAHQASAREGKAVGGRRPFGYEDDKVTPRETEAGLIREAAAEVLAGVTLTAIARRWNDLGVETVTGSGPWTSGKLLQLLRSPRIAGWRVYRATGQKWSPVPTIAVDKNGDPVRGQWEPIIDDATHKALVAALTGKPEKRKRVPRRNTRTFLLTGLLRCGKCGQNSPMYGNRRSETAYYYQCADIRCNNSGSGPGIDSWVSEIVVASSELVVTNTTATAPPAEITARLRELDQHIDGTTEMIEDLMSAYRARKISAKVAFSNATQLEESRDAALAERETLSEALAADSHEAIDQETWDGLDTDRRRAACERVLSAVYLRETGSKRGNVFDSSRLDAVWK